MKVRAPSWTLAMIAVIATVEQLEDGPMRGYEGDQPRIRLTWGKSKTWSVIEHAGFLEQCEEVEP